MIKNRKKRTIEEKIFLLSFFVAIISFVMMFPYDSSGPELKSVEIDDIVTYKGRTKRIGIVMSPRNAIIDKISFDNYDKSIISIKGRQLKTLNEGETTVECKIIDKYSQKQRVFTFKVTVLSSEWSIDTIWKYKGVYFCEWIIRNL